MVPSLSGSPACSLAERGYSMWSDTLLSTHPVFNSWLLAVPLCVLVGQGGLWNRGGGLELGNILLWDGWKWIFMGGFLKSQDKNHDPLNTPFHTLTQSIRTRDTSLVSTVCLQIERENENLFCIVHMMAFNSNHVKNQKTQPKACILPLLRQE